MRKHVYLGILFALFSVHTVHASDNVREEIRQTFVAEIGVQELTGNNDGPRVEEYLAVTGLGSGFYWCAAFPSWVFTECGIKNPKSAWSPDWFPPHRVIYFRGGKNNQVPQCSDVFGFYFASKARIAHMGFMGYWGESTAITVEGNSNALGSSNGNAVVRKYRLISQISKVSKWVP